MERATAAAITLTRWRRRERRPIVGPALAALVFLIARRKLANIIWMILCRIARPLLLIRRYAVGRIALLPAAVITGAATPIMVELGEAGRKETFQRLTELQADGALCDVTLRAGGCELKAHACILATASTPLRSLIDAASTDGAALSSTLPPLSSPGIRLRDGPPVRGRSASCASAFSVAVVAGGIAAAAKANVVVSLPPDVDAESLRTLLDFIYGRPIALRPDNVEPLLALSARYGVAPLRRRCCERLAAAAAEDDSATCGLLAVADRRGCRRLRAQLLARVLSRFGAACAPGIGAFLALPLPLVAEILGHDRLAASESDVFRAAVAWLAHDGGCGGGRGGGDGGRGSGSSGGGRNGGGSSGDCGGASGNRAAAADLIMSLVRLALMDPAYLAAKVEPHPLMQTEVTRAAVHAAYRYLALPPARRPELAGVMGGRATPRRPLPRGACTTVGLAAAVVEDAAAATAGGRGAAWPAVAAADAAGARRRWWHRGRRAAAGAAAAAKEEKAYRAGCNVTAAGGDATAGRAAAAATLTGNSEVYQGNAAEAGASGPPFSKSDGRKAAWAPAAEGCPHTAAGLGQRSSTAGSGSLGGGGGGGSGGSAGGTARGSAGAEADAAAASAAVADAEDAFVCRPPLSSIVGIGRTYV